jgi:DnaJ like chaperone protein
MLTLIGALFGALFGGFSGLIIGGLIGYAAGHALKQSVMGGLQIAQSQFVDSTFSIMGALCKAD